MSSFLQALAAAYGFLFLGAFLGKLDSWAHWRFTLRRFIPGSDVAATGLAFALPVCEAAAGVLLFVDPAAGLFAAGALLVVLAAGVGVLSIRHRGQACNCFGAFMPSEIGVGLALRNAVLAIVAMTAGAAAARAGVSALTALQVAVALAVAVVVLLASEIYALHKIQRSRNQARGET